MTVPEVPRVPADLLERKALCDAWLAEIERIYGKEFAAKSRATYHRGWYYLQLAQRFPDGSIGRLPTFGRAGLLSAHRRKQVVKMVENLRKREARDE